MKSGTLQLLTFFVDLKNEICFLKKNSFLSDVIILEKNIRPLANTMVFLC